MNKIVEEKEFEFYLQKTGKTKNKTILKRQWMKFGTADFDGNRKLGITEFTAFLFPQFYEGTKDLLKKLHRTLIIYSIYLYFLTEKGHRQVLSFCKN